MKPRPSTRFAPPRNIQSLMNVALGHEKADLAVINANLVNVYSGELLAGQSVCIRDRWIAYVGQNPDPSIGPDTQVIDAAGQTLIPGLIDGHTHLAWLIRNDEFIRHAAAGGTTAMVTETLEAYPIAGVDGVMDFIDALADQPIKVFCTAPFMASISSRSRGVAIEDLHRILARPEIVGLGESYWQALLQNPAEMTAALEETLKTGKPLEGHSAGASERKLNAYLAAGITSCHEPIQAAEVLQRLRLGLHVMVREGSIRRDLKQIARINASQAELRRLVLVTDGLSPQDLVEKGCMEFVVQKAIDSGFGPITAIQMATLNVAEHFGLDGLIGGIAPGRLADMLIVPDMGRIQAQTVISDGRLIARNGQLMVAPRCHQFSEACMNTVRLPRPLSGSDFRIPVASGRPAVTVRAIEMVTDLVTKESHIDLSVENGELIADADQDLLKIAAIDRARNDGRMFVGIIKGFGLRQGALACSTSWDSADVIVVGANDSDMALAVNRIREHQGGAVVCNHGKSAAEVGLPILGIMSDRPLKETLEQLTLFNLVLSKLGVTLPDPLLTLSTLSGAAIPYFRICEEGLVNLKDGKTKGLLVTD